MWSALTGQFEKKGETVMTVQLETTRLLLRFFELSDAARVQQLAGSEEVARTTLAIPHPYPDGAAEAWIERTRQTAESGNGYAFAMIRKEDGLLVGNMSMGVSPKHKRAELAYWVGKPYWGQGYATEAARRVVQFGFEELQLNRIFAAAMTKNPGSYNVMRKIGMKEEGMFPQHVLKWGEYEDLVFYGMVRSEAGR
jgi:ribosomal-protein-alanine N-acetyltransferase